VTYPATRHITQVYRRSELIGHARILSTQPNQIGTTHISDYPPPRGVKKLKRTGGSRVRILNPSLPTGLTRNQPGPRPEAGNQVSGSHIT